jgi:hypothetical protein
MMNEVILSDEVLSNIKEKIRTHHQLYRFPVKAELWEDIFDQCINPNSDWEGGGHSVGADIIACTDELFNKGARLQLKSGELNSKNGTLKWNGHRTTQYNTIEEKIDFISNNHYDYYVMLSRDKSVWKLGKKVYHLFIFRSDMIDYSSLNWSEKINKWGKLSGWRGINTVPYKAEINRSMSDQLWTTCNTSYIGKSYEIEV